MDTPTTEVLVTSVTFDTDGNESLATSLSGEWSNVLFEVPDTDEPFDEFISNYLSDETGWCVRGLTVQLMN